MVGLGSDRSLPMNTARHQPLSCEAWREHSMFGAGLLTCRSLRFRRPSHPNGGIVELNSAGALAAHSGATVRAFHPLPFSLVDLRRAPPNKVIHNRIGRAWSRERLAYVGKRIQKTENRRLKSEVRSQNQPDRHTAKQEVARTILRPRSSVFCLLSS